VSLDESCGWLLSSPPAQVESLGWPWSAAEPQPSSSQGDGIGDGGSQGTAGEQLTQTVDPPHADPGAATKQSAEVLLDWKGEPMHLNPGDKLPFKFL